MENNTQTKVKELLENRKSSSVFAMEVFDSLESIKCDEMLGRWKGYEILTGHPIEGLLEITGWYGKMFLDTETVHPLLFYTNNKKALYAVDPKFIPLHINFPKSTILSFVMRLLKPILKTKKSKARLRMITYRNKTTATMAYDEKAIFDHFAKIDNNTVLGCMDLKNEIKPYFFVLERDNNSNYRFEF